MDAELQKKVGHGLGVPDEKQLIAGLRRGNATSYECLMGAYGGRMLATARRLVQNEADARDCVQEAFIQAFKALQGFEGRSSLGSWLHKIVVNIALTKIRSRDRRREDSIEDLTPRYDEDGLRIEPAGQLVPIDTLLEQTEVCELVRHSINKLPESYRTILLLRDIEGYDTEETAAILELTLGTAKTRLHRARAALKHLLEPVLRQ